LKTSYLKITLLSICALLINTCAFAATFDWTGRVSTDVTDPQNWAQPGLLVCPTTPGINDDVRFGVTTTYTLISIICVNLGSQTIPYTYSPVITTNVSWKSITLGPLRIDNTITVNSPGVLTVTGDITLAVNNSGSTNPNGNNYLIGTGTITCNNIKIGSGTTKTGGNDFLFSRVSTLNVTGNVNIVLNTSVVNGSGFRLENGNMYLTGQIAITNPYGVTSSNAGYFTINGTYTTGTATKTSASLYLANAAALASIPSPYASVNFNGSHSVGGRTNVYYTGSSPTIYTTSFTGFGSGGGSINSTAQYDNLYIQGTGTALVGSGNLVTDSTLNTSTSTTLNLSTNNPNINIGTDWTNSSIVTGSTGTIDVNGSLNNSGTMTMGTGALTIAKDYTNTGTFTPNATPTITFDGTTQTLTDATATGTNFYNVTFTGGSTKTMASGSKFTVAPLYTLNVTPSASAGSTLAVSNATPTTTALTLLSTSAGDASIGSLVSGGFISSITGSINVQRYVKGTLRRYMLLSSPVLNGTTTFTTTGSLSTYNLLPLIATTYITGPSGGGFDSAPTTGNSPSVFVYDENAPVSTNVNQVINNEYKPFNSTSEGLPAANGFLYYFRGSRSVVNPFVRPFPATDNATLNFFGTVIKGTGTAATNAQLTANIVNFPNTVPLYYTATAVSAPATLSYHTTYPAKQGLNLIGNPYASLIDLHALYLANPNNKFYYMLVKDVNTGTNSSSTKFAFYDASIGTTGSAGTGASRYALSGQGFFTVAISASAIKFDESMKVAYSNYSAPSPPVFNVVGNPGKNISASFAANAASNNVGDVLPRLTMELVQDTIVHNSTDINFDSNATTKFVPGEDAPYYQPSGQGDLFYSLSSDSIGCFANYTGNLEKLKRINLVVTFSKYATYKLTSPVKKNIDARYSIHLMDKYTNDSLDVVHNAEYAFNVESNPASYAHDRFYLKIGIVPGHDYRLLSFTGKKVTEGISLNWETNNESNFTKFGVQKSADGGKIFLTIDSLQSTGAGKYTYTDQTPGTGQLIYRLSQNLVTGENKLSDNLNFDIKPGAGVSKFLVYPTVVSASTVNIKLQQTSANPVRISIVSPSGAIVKKLSATGTNTIQENVNGLSRGLYIVVAVNENTGDRIGSGMFFKQ
jgi:hypothetical protein